MPIKRTSPIIKITLKISSKRKLSLEIRSEFAKDFANKISKPIPTKANAVIKYLNLFP